MHEFALIKRETVFEDKALADQAVQAVHKQIGDAPMAPVDITEENPRSKEA